MVPVCQAIFCTLNPADVLHPFTLYFSNNGQSSQVFRLAALTPGLGHALRQSELARVVAEDPLAATRAFYQHVRHFAADLLCCTIDPRDLDADNLAATGCRGIFGPVAAFFGAVEPQLRGSLHIHILLYLHGFGSPQALARFEQSRPLLEAALAAWVQSILQTSVEQVADTWCLNPDAALACLRPLPYSDWQRQAVGEDMDEYVHLTSTGWRAAGSPDAFVPSPGPWYGPAAVTATADDCDSSFIPYPREYLAWGPEAPQTAFQESLLWDYRASLLACQMHSCRAKTCAKGWLGRHGFCRLGFWHWQDVSSPARPHHWMRRHGQELRCPALVRELPPGLGTFETERHHHWVARHNLAILLTRQRPGRES